MCSRRPQLALFASLLVLILGTTTARAQNQPFTYQGKLADGGSPAAGPVDLIVNLFASEIGGTPIGTQTINGVPLIGGVFTITLNAAGEFTPNPFASGADRWVELTVNGQPVSPRQKLTVAPMAAFSAAPWVLNGTMLSYTGGNVGIGTDTPDRPLSINQASAPGGGVRASQLIGFQTDLVTRWHVNLFSPNGNTSTDYGLNFAESGIADFRFFLAKGGNVGIGTSSPTGRLEIASLYDTLVLRPPTMLGSQAVRIAFKDPDGGTPTTNLSFVDTGYSNLSINSAAGSPARLGVNTTDPTQAIDVRGEIAFGLFGQYSPVASGSGNTRMLFALVNPTDGSLTGGSGVSVTKLGVGNFRVTFTTPFIAYPAVVVTPIAPGVAVHCSTNFFSPGKVDVDIFNAAGNRLDLYFSIIAIGPR